ncbi:MAG: hypothetical protein SNG27_01645 [Rikenellaceae bacterium]
MVKRIITTLVVLLCCCVNTISAQNSSAKSMERDIKVSGNYYYGDGNSADPDEARSMAIEELKIMITESVRMDNPDVTTVNFSGFDNSLGIVSIDLEGYTRVIAFILKSEISVEDKGLKSLMVIRLSPDGPEILNGQEEEVEVVEEPKVIEIMGSKPKTTETKVEEPKVETPQQITSTTTTSTTGGYYSSSSSPSSSKASSSSSPSSYTSNNIINEILKLTESKDVGALLNRYKENGNLVYGRLSTISDPTVCYFVILRSGKLIDVLDRGTGTSRKGLKSGSLVDYSKSYDIIYWVYIY